MVSQVEEIKRKLDIVDIIGKYLPLKKKGRNYWAPCPFHSEKTPSFTVNQELQIFKCFGCGKAGDMFTFLEEYDHLEFREVLEELAKLAGVELKHDPAASVAESRHRRLIDLNHEVAKFYNYILVSHPLGRPAREYLAGRGISSATIKIFRLGFSPDNPALLQKYLEKQKFSLSEMIASGTFGQSYYQKNRLYDRFSGRLTFPLVDFRDRILGFSGRVLPGLSKAEAAKYLNSPETELYHKSEMVFGLNLAKESIKKSNQVVVVEGEFDMISPWQSGFTNFVALKGTAFTEDQLKLLARYTSNLVLGLDTDFAGSAAARRSIELADKMEFNIEVLALPDPCKDPDEAVRNAPDRFKEALLHPIPIWDFIINSALKTYDTASPRGKQQILSATLPFLSRINNLVTRSDYYQKLASLIGSSPDAVVAEAAKYNSLNVKVVDTQTVAEKIDTKISKTEYLEKYLLSLIFATQKPRHAAGRIFQKVNLSTSRFQKIIDEIVNYKFKFNPVKFSRRLPPELLAIFNDIYLESTRFEFDSAFRLREINKTINQILEISLRDQLQKLSLKITQAEQTGESTDSLDAEYNNLLTRLSKLQKIN